MSELNLLDYQHYWWILISLLAGLLVYLMYVQGGQMLFYVIGKNETERALILNSLGGKWEVTFTTLVTFGGAFFASFPLFYATSFGGAYWVWIIILFSFIVQAVSYEYIRKHNNFLGYKTYAYFLIINGFISTILIGAAVGTFFTGSQFSINDYFLQKWEHPLRGLEAALNITNLLLGFSIFFLTRCLGLLYFINIIDYNNIWEKCIKRLKIEAVLFLAVFLAFLAIILTKDGFAYNPDTKVVFMEKYKYFNNFIQMPLVSILFLTGVVLVLLSFYITIYIRSRRGIWLAAAGSTLTVFSLFLIAGLNNTSFYPSNFNLQSSLTIENSSSSLYTLKAMSYVSLLIPVVIGYIAYAWRLMDKRKISQVDLEHEESKY